MLSSRVARTAAQFSHFEHAITGRQQRPYMALERAWSPNIFGLIGDVWFRMWQKITTHFLLQQVSPQSTTNILNTPTI
jgi:hypothetical protein